MNETQKKPMNTNLQANVQETKAEVIITSHELITQGLPVYLMQPKLSVPYKGTRGHLDSVTDYRKLTKMFIDARSNSNIGINLTNTGIVVLDIDKHKSNGFKSLTQSGYSLNLDNEIWEMSPQAGAHVFFKLPDGVSAKDLKHNLLDGVELLTDHVTMSPSSRMIDGKEIFYKHFGGKITDCNIAPNWLIKLAMSVATSGNGKKSWKAPNYSIDQRIEMLLNGFQEGERNQQVMSFSGWLLGIRGIDPNLIYELVQKINSESNSPLPDKEINTIFRSAYNREVKRASLGGR